MESDAEVGRLEQLARSAGKAAGLPMSRLRVRLLSGENAVNRSAMVSTENGARHVLREYRWPFGGPDDLDRPGKEEWRSGLVRQSGVPAPRELSRVVVGDVVVVLREYLPGRPLGDVPTDREAAWRAAGTMMARVHAIEIGDGPAGVVVGESVRPFGEGSWVAGNWRTR